MREVKKDLFAVAGMWLMTGIGFCCLSPESMRPLLATLSSVLLLYSVIQLVRIFTKPDVEKGLRFWRITLVLYSSFLLSNLTVAIRYAAVVFLLPIAAGTLCVIVYCIRCKRRPLLAVPLIFPFLTILLQILRPNPLTTGGYLCGAAVTLLIAAVKLPA